MSWGASKAALLGILAGIGVSAGVVASAPWADAKAMYESPYGYDRTWNAALRFVRVDNGWKVTEKDDTGGYLLFEYRSLENAKPTAGSFELVRGREPDAPVSVLVQLPRMPHYHEQVMLDTFASKLRREYGDPPDRNRLPPPPGADASVE